METRSLGLHESLDFLANTCKAIITEHTFLLQIQWEQLFLNINLNWTINGNYFQGILNSESWIFHLTEANKDNSVNPTWFKLYSFKDEYGVESLSPIELDKLTHKLAGNSSLIQEYSR